MARIGFIVGEDFEDSELRVPLDRMRGAGHEVTIVGVMAGQVLEGKKHKEKIAVDASADDVDAEEFDAIVIPGGYSPDHLRVNGGVVDLVRDMDDEHKLIAAVCHGPSLLIEADIVEDRQITSWPSIRTDLENAGARWVDEQVVIDRNVITSRNPGDLDAFSTAILDRLAGRSSEDAFDDVTDEDAAVRS
ncbi:MAG TPA: type 1 glutamine amidotransferase domain-containing protein [Myxococcota bacterium]|jgi:protease I